MEEPLEAAAAAGGKACFADELLLLDFTSNTYRPAAAAATAAAASGELQHQALLFQDFFDPSVDGLPGLPAEGGGGGDEEEEELEWLADKDAFPALETSFEIPAHSRSSSSSSGGSGSGVGAAAGAGAVGERPSPVSALAAAASFSVPARPRSKGPRRRRRVLAGHSPEPAATAGAALPERRRCRHCQAEETPQWRAGPEGPKTLCNACGVRYKSGRLVPEYRPASSPTFSSAIHSNSHRRILEMRRQKASTQRRSTRAPPPPLVTPPVM